MTNDRLNIPFKRKIKISLKGVMFAKATMQPVKGQFVISGDRRIYSRSNFTFSIISADKQKKERNPNYRYFSLK